MEREVSDSGAITQKDRELIRKVFSSPLDIPPVWKTWLKAWLESDPPRLMATSLVGYFPMTATAAGIATSESTSSTSYTNLSTTGPELVELEAGVYLLLFGATATIYGASDKHAMISPSLNGASASDSDRAQYEQESNTSSGSGTSVMRATVASLPNQENTVLLKYRVDGGTGHFKDRWIIALRIGNV